MNMADYYVDIDDSGEHPRPIQAADFAEAAEKGAERDDSESGEYFCAGGNDLTVKVRHGVTGEIKVFTVNGYQRPCYDATALPEEE
jgi:hypothetical protein